MDTITRSCNVCSRIKQNPNQPWFVVVMRPGAPGIGFGAEDADYNESGLQVEHICSDRCMHVRLSRWIDTQRENKEAA